MFERLKKRLEDAERARAVRGGEPHVLSIDCSTVSPKVAWSGESFRCHRREGEDETGFMIRAHSEYREAEAPWPAQILFFADKVPNAAA
jgi:hypothetical protein